MSAPLAKSFIIQGVDGPIEIAPGEFYFNTKMRCHEMMKKFLSRGARRVHACLEMHTMGWRQELAVIPDGKGGVRPLTTGDIARECELNEGDVRRFLDELQAAGLAERRTKNGTDNFVKGNVEIYSWARPKRPDPKKIPLRAHGIPEWAADESLKPLLAYAKRCRYKLPDDLGDARTRIQEAEEVARLLEEADKAAARFLESVCAPTTHNKEERTDRTSERTSSSSPPSSNGHVPVAVEEKKEEEEPPQITPTPKPPPQAHPPKAKADPLLEEFIALYPPGRIDHGKVAALWKLMSFTRKDGAIAWLKLNRNCPRWTGENGRWIPLASNFLRQEQYLHPPDPPLDVKRGRESLPMDEVLAMWEKREKT